MGDWSLMVDVKPALERVSFIRAGVADRKKLHERIVIVLQRRVFKGWPSGPPLSGFTMLTRKGSAVLLDKGYLRQSLTGSDPSRISTAKDTLNMAASAVSVLGSKVPYAAIQNFGGVIRPRSAANLSLPATDEARQAGSPRNFGSELHWVPVKNSGGHSTGWLAERIGRGKAAQLIRHYLLMDEVTIEARKFFPTEAEVQEDTGKVLDHWLASLADGKSEEGAA